MLLTIAIVLGLLWLIGFSIGAAGGLIHLVLLIALVVLVYDLVTRRHHV
jgi:hypothetical protein